MKILAGVSIIFSCYLLMPGFAAADPEQRISPFSGKQVPRFESLRYSTVNGRTGPSLDYPIAWRYERAGLPVMIIKESMDWRRVRDPEGTEVWIHARMLSGRETAMIRTDTPLKRTPAAGAKDIALLQSGVIVKVLERKADQLKVQTDNLKGWVALDGVWGERAS
jgi:SH3-like domain-containing protein